MATHSSIAMDREAWQATVHGVAKSQTRLSTYVWWWLCYLASLPNSRFSDISLITEIRHSESIYITEISKHYKLPPNSQNKLVNIYQHVCVYRSHHVGTVNPAEMAQGWIHSPLKPVSEWGQRTWVTPKRQPDPRESPFYREGWVKKIWCPHSVLIPLPPLRYTKKILFKFPWQSWSPSYQGWRDRNLKGRLNEQGPPVPVPCECLTSSGGSENAGLCPSVFYLFIFN